jgi:hypothetical protein
VRDILQEDLNKANVAKKAAGIAGLKIPNLKIS